jgi:hypothetical protein
MLSPSSLNWLAGFSARRTDAPLQRQKSLATLRHQKSYVPYTGVWKHICALNLLDCPPSLSSPETRFSFKENYSAIYPTKQQICPLRRIVM